MRTAAVVYASCASLSRFSASGLALLARLALQDDDNNLDDEIIKVSNNGPDGAHPHGIKSKLGIIPYTANKVNQDRAVVHYSLQVREESAGHARGVGDECALESTSMRVSRTWHQSGVHLQQCSYHARIDSSTRLMCACCVCLCCRSLPPLAAAARVCS
jgi:hypothetical protein